MEKIIKDRFVVENKNDRTFVDVELVERATFEDIQLEPDEQELELEDIDIVTLRETVPAVSPDEATRRFQAPNWAHSNKQSAVLYPKPKVREEPDDLATIISAIPADARLQQENVIVRLLSYVGVAAISVIGTWLVIGPHTTQETKRDAEQGTAALVITKPQSSADTPPVIDKNEVSPPAPVGQTEPPKKDSKKKKSDMPAPPTPTLAEQPIETNKKASHSPETKKRLATNSLGTSAVKKPKNHFNQQNSNENAHANTLPAKHEPLEKRQINQQNSNENTHANSLPAKHEPLEKRQNLSKAEVRKTMAGFKPRVQQCKKNISGRLVVELVVSGATGKVISSKPIDQVEVGKTAAECAARIVGTAQFPTFEKDELKIKYPYDLQ